MVTDVACVSDAARELSAETGLAISPRDITALFYQRELRDDLCPIVSGRRLIPRNYLPEVLAAMRRRGWLRREGDSR